MLFYPFGWCCPFLEPKGLDGTGSRRPDIQVHFPDGSCLVDASITHPAAKTYAPMGSTTPLSAAIYRERFKHRKYDIIAADEKSPFYPFVMETFGGFGPEALVFLSRLSKSHSALSTSPAPKNAFRTHVIRALSICLQRGNALVQLVGCRQARQHAGALVGFPLF